MTEAQAEALAGLLNSMPFPVTTWKQEDGTRAIGADVVTSWFVVLPPLGERWVVGENRDLGT